MSKKRLLVALSFCFSVFSVALGQSNSDKTKFTPFYPSQHSAGAGVLCSLGNSSKCERVSTELLRNIDKCSTSLKVMGLVENVGFLFRDSYAETFFFQELTNRTVRATDCQVSILKDSKRAPLHQASWKIFQELQPILKLLSEERKRLQQEHDSWNLAAADPRTAGASGATDARKRLQTRISSIDQSIDGLLAQVPFGSQKDTRKALKPLIGKDSVTQAQFIAAYTKGLDKVKSSLIQTQRTFKKILNEKTGEYNLSTSHKIELYSTPGAQALLDQLDPRRKSLGCMFDACYKTGPKNAKIGALIAIGGATILTLGQASPLLAAVTTLGAVSLSATQVQHSCFRSTIASTAEVYNSCSAYALANTTLSQVNGLQCAVDVALASLDAVPGAAAIRKLVQTRRLANGVKSLEQTGFRFIRKNSDGSIVTRASNGTDDVEMTMHLNGRRETVWSNGTKQVEENGVTTTFYNNGMKDIKQNGITISHMPDGTPFRKTFADGKTEDLLEKADDINEVEEIVVTAKKNKSSDDGLVISPDRKPGAISNALKKFRKRQYNKNVERFSAKYKSENPGATNSEAMAHGRSLAIAKERRIADLHKQCTSVKPNASNIEAGKIFAKYAVGFNSANTLIGYTMATWDKAKDFNWAASLGYELTKTIIFSYLSSKVLTGGSLSFPKKVAISNATNFFANMGDALVYQGFFQSTEEAKAEIEKMAKSPTLVSDINKLLDFLHNRPEIQEYADGIGDMSNNLIRAVTGKDKLEDLTEEELAEINQDSLKDPEVRERLLDLVDDQLYAGDKNYTTGNAALDRLAFNTGYDLVNTPVQTAIGMASFYAVCMNIDKPLHALAAFGTIQFVRGNASSLIYFRARENAIGQ